MSEQDPSRDLDLLNQQLPTDTTSRPNIDYILVDSSGSMYHQWADCMSAIDGLVEGLKNENVDTTVTMAQFSAGYGGSLDYRVEREHKPAEWYTVQGIQNIGGGTPLYDSINHGCRILHEKMPGKCTLYIVTDGEDTSSKTTVEQAKSLLDWCRRRGWQIIFIGAGFENSRQAKMLGANPDNYIGIKAKELTHVTSELAKKRGHYDKFGAPMGFSDEEKKKFGGYLPPANGK